MEPEPRACHTVIANNRIFRNLQDVSEFLNAQPGKKAHREDAASARVLALEPPEQIVDDDQLRYVRFCQCPVRAWSISI